MTAICTWVGCNSPQYANSLCKAHWELGHLFWRNYDNQQ